MDGDEDDPMKVWQLEAWVGQFPPPPPIPPHLKIPASGGSPDPFCDLCSWAQPPKKTLLAAPTLDAQCWIIILIAIFVSSVATLIVMILVQKCLRLYRENNPRRIRAPSGENNIIEAESSDEVLKTSSHHAAQNLYTNRPLQSQSAEEGYSEPSAYETIDLNTFPQSPAHVYQQPYHQPYQRTPIEDAND